MTFLGGLILGGPFLGYYSNSNSDIKIKEYRKKFHVCTEKEFDDLRKKDKKSEEINIINLIKKINEHNRMVRRRNSLAIEYNKLLTEGKIIPTTTINEFSIKSRKFSEKIKYIFKIKGIRKLFSKGLNKTTKNCVGFNFYTNKRREIDIKSVYIFYYYKTHYERKYVILLKTEIDKVTTHYEPRLQREL
jgi:hypothetical protein